MTFRVSFTMPGCKTVPHVAAGCCESAAFNSSILAEQFATAIRAQGADIDVRVTTTCPDCNGRHDAEAMPPECEDCGTCLGDAWEGVALCAPCVADRDECECGSACLKCAGVQVDGGWGAR